MNKTQKTILAILIIALAGGAYYFFRSPKEVKKIDLEKKKVTENTGPVSPISGLSCENWNRRPVAVMQPSDLQARPAAGFSEADMVIEMPAYTSSVKLPP